MARMSFREACDLVDDDLPDGAFFAMAHELAGMEYGDGFAEFDPGPRRPAEPIFKLGKRWRTKLEKIGEVKANDTYHWQVRKGGKVLADWWPHKNKWRISGQNFRGDVAAFHAALTKAQPHNQGEE